MSLGPAGAVGALLLGAALAGTGPAASAHELWLTPSRYQAAPGDTVALGARVGTGSTGDPVPYPALRSEALGLRGARSLDLRPVARPGALTWARWIEGDSGGSLLYFRSGFTPIELPADRFDAYLREEGLLGPLRARARSGRNAGAGRERFTRCAKAWIAGLAGENVESRATKPVGLPLEIVPLQTPGCSPTLQVRVLWRGHPLPDALVRVWVAPLDPSLGSRNGAASGRIAMASARTGPDGLLTVRLERDGAWLLHCIHMIPSEDPRAADWDSYWASLAFAKP